MLNNMGRSSLKKNALSQVKPSVFANERMEKQGFMRNKHLFTLEKESMLHPPLKVQTASVSSQTDEFIPQTILNRNELTLRPSSNGGDSRRLSLDDSTSDKDRQVDEISMCISHLSLDLKNEEESKRIRNVLHPGCEDQRVKNKHKNRRKRSLKHDDNCILRDINGALKHYDSLCSTYLFKTRNSNLFVKCKGNSESSRSNVQKIANGVKTCILQSYFTSEPWKIHFRPSVLIEEETHLSPNERRNLPGSYKSKVIDEPNDCLSSVKLGIQHPWIGENVQRVEGLIEEDPMAKQKALLFRNTASLRTRNNKRNVKKNSKALLLHRSEQDGSYSTEDTDTEDTPRNGLSLQKVENRKKSFQFAENRTGWVDSNSEGCLEQQHISEEKHSADGYIRPSSFTSPDDDEERNIQLPLNNSVIRQQHNERYLEGQGKVDGLIEEVIPNKRNRSLARKASPLKAKKRKKIVKKIPKAPQLHISQHKDFPDDTDTEVSPQKKTSSLKLQNQSVNYEKRTPEMSKNERSADDIEQDYTYDDEEMPNTELCSSESSLFNFSSGNYNLQFPKCSSFVLIMGNQLGKHLGISDSMETLCSTSQREHLQETSGNEMLQELSQKMEGFSLNDLTGQEANVPLTDDFESAHGSQVAVPGDGDSVESDHVLNFAAGDLRFDFTPSPQLKVRKIVFKKKRNVRKFLFRSNKGALYLKTII